MMTQIIRFLDRPELVTRNAVLACYALPMLLYLWVVFRALRFSSRVKRADFEHPEPDKRRWRLCTLCVSLIMIALTAVLVLFVFPHAPDQEEIFWCAGHLNRYPAYVLIMLVAFVCFPLVGPCWRAAFRALNYDHAGCLVCGISILALIFTGLGAIYMPAFAVFMTESTGVSDFDESAIHQATAYYEAGFYHQASACFEMLSQRSPFGSEARNNLALCCLQLGKNEEALEIMRGLVTGTRNPYYIVNLLVAAQANGISAREILTEIDADRMLSSSTPIKLANALAYNILWMDMELPQGDADLAVNISEELFDNNRLLAFSYGRSKDERLLDYDSILQKMNRSNSRELGQEDPDISALQIYLQALMDGGEPQTVSAE